eukprot:4053364-Pleurochrysis_carterae.AAC.2
MPTSQRCASGSTCESDRPATSLWSVGFTSRFSVRFLVNRTDGVTVDEEGEQHTLQLAKQSRMLGGNTGYFSGDPASIVVVMKNVKFNVVWVSCKTTDMSTVFDLSPAESDITYAAGGEDYQKYAADAVESFMEAHHRDDPMVPGGGMAIKEGLLVGPNHLLALFKRRRAKPYLT